MKRFGLIVAAAVFSMSSVWAGSDKTYMKINGESVSQSQFQKYETFLTEFSPGANRDKKTLKKETESYLTDLFIIRQESKAYGHEVTNQMRDQVLTSIASSRGLDMDKWRKQLDSRGVDPYMLADHYLMSDLLLQIMRDRYQDTFEVSNANITKKQKEMTHDQVRLNAAVLPSLLASTEEKAAMLSVLKKKKGTDAIQFVELGWAPEKNFPKDVTEEFAKIKKTGFTETVSVEGNQSVRFQVLERRVFVPERNKVKEALLLEFLTKKQESWLASKKKSAKIRRY